MPSSNSTILEMPTELAYNILRQTMGDGESPLDVHLSADRLYERSGLTWLRQVSPLYESKVDYLLQSAGKMNIWLHGPVPFDNFDKMSQIYSEWLSKVQGHVLLTRIHPCEVVIHLCPKLTGTNAEMSWCLGSKNAPAPSGSGAIQAAQKAMTGHHAAALMLCSILYFHMSRDADVRNKFKLRLVFHEVDGSCLDEETKLKMLEDHNTFTRPRLLPFWDYKAVGMLVYHWQWIANPDLRPSHSEPMSEYLTLPAMAMASRCQVGDSNAYACMREYVANFWRCPLSPDPRKKLYIFHRPEYTQSRHGESYCLPGFEGEVRFPMQTTFVRWLTERCPTIVVNRCWVTWGAELFDREEQRDAVLMPRPQEVDAVEPSYYWSHDTQGRFHQI